MRSLVVLLALASAFGVALASRASLDKEARKLAALHSVEAAAGSPAAAPSSGAAAPHRINWPAADASSASLQASSSPAERHSYHDDDSDDGDAYEHSHHGHGHKTETYTGCVCAHSMTEYTYADDNWNNQ
jgi:hypothetical protein